MPGLCRERKKYLNSSVSILICMYVRRNLKLKCICGLRCKKNATNEQDSSHVHVYLMTKLLSVQFSRRRSRV